MTPRTLHPPAIIPLSATDTDAAQAVARCWGEASWTDRLGFEIACLDAAIRCFVPRAAFGRVPRFEVQLRSRTAR